MQKIFVRIVALYLFWFSIVFILAITAGDSLFLSEGTFLGDLLIRRPYQIDFELMFTVLFFVWGIFLWKASSRLDQSQLFLRFSGWAFLTHATVFIIIGLIKSEVLTHAITDGIGWALTGTLLFKANK
ncbi:MAG: hypothetical protein KBB91_02920 [Candidatus Pacebacteria bacterium]|nr:hypothetical protein [Candidatus Paceibacterota bacterium]MBP9701085.1 hypothetical protein [Candidatus Paceibacterota bacterium]